MARSRQRRRKNSRVGILAISFMVLALFAVIAYKGEELKIKNEDYIAKEASLVAQIQAEQERTKELQEYSKYVKTKKYIEEVAREKLGLIYEDEIIFKPK